MARHQLKLDWYTHRTVDHSITHEQFVHSVAALGIGLLDEQDKKQAQQCKLTYGAGQPGLRGVTMFNRWINDKDEQAHFVEICASGEANPVQVAGTTLHELGHVLAGHKAAHGKEWHVSCDKLGLRQIKAAGTNYCASMFDPRIRAAILALCERLNDGRPVQGGGLNFGPLVLKPCSAGIGSRGGKSRGVGSGSRLRKYQCQCGQILRAATDTLEATHNPCGGLFTLQA